jgi:hypothetical protein
VAGTGLKVGEFSVSCELSARVARKQLGEGELTLGLAGKVDSEENMEQGSTALAKR